MEKLTIAIAGASGFIGSALSKTLSLHHQVIALPRDITHLPEVDVVINLSGAPIYKPWSRQVRQEIISSRVATTKRLVELISKLKVPPSTFISASAVGYYGDRGEEILTETSPPGAGFLPSVCMDWEFASLPLEEMGVRRVLARFGIVMGSGGILQKLLPLAKLHLAGRSGSGDQWMSWIALDDLVQVLHAVIQNPQFQGPINCVSPNPVQQKEFAKVLAEAIHVSWQLPQPASFIQLLLGDMGKELLLSSTRAVPTKLLNAHFLYQHPNLSDALHKALTGLKLRA